jgi:type II secretory pathway pseudopilin PulG
MRPTTGAVSLVEVMIAAVIVGVAIAAVMSSVVSFNASRQMQQVAIETAYLSGVEARRMQLGDTTSMGSSVIATDVGGVIGLSKIRYTYTWQVRPGVSQTGYYDCLSYVAPGEPQM